MDTYTYTIYIIFFSLFSDILRSVYWTERKTSEKDSRILDKTQHYSMFYLHSTMAKCCMEQQNKIVMYKVANFVQNAINNLTKKQEEIK